MSDQQILKKAPLPDWTHYFDDTDHDDDGCCYSYLKQVEGINGQEVYKLGWDRKRRIWIRVDAVYNTMRSRFDIERIAELEKVLLLVHNDLMHRAEEDSWGYKVVAVGSSVWETLKRVITEKEDG